jgi:hypothetical protein
LPREGNRTGDSHPWQSASAFLCFPSTPKFSSASHAQARAVGRPLAIEDRVQGGVPALALDSGAGMALRVILVVIGPYPMTGPSMHTPISRIR